MIKISASIFLLSVLVCFNIASAQPDSTSWFPLSVGNWWSYKFDGFAIDEDDTVFYSATDHKEITAILDHQNGNRVYELRTISISPTDTDTSFMYLNQTENQIRFYRNTTTDRYDVLISSAGEIVDSVSVPAGYFTNCIVTTEPPSYDVTVKIYYHRGTGMIKTVYSSVFFNATELLTDFYLCPTESQ